jgi:succinate-semialdehyde dehydrogenase / glutarate-semialdehyde dehydrogenase
MNPDMHISYPRIGLFIAGQWIFDDESKLVVRNPSNESALGTVPVAGDDDLEKALASAQRGFQTWRETAPQTRVQVIRRAVDLIRTRSDLIARTITFEHGKPFADAQAEVERSISFFEWDMAEALRNFGTIIPAQPGMQKLVVREPIGPIAAFTPWNVPLSAPSRKVSAALASGCSIILKAAEETPGAAVLLVQCFEEAGLPPGVLNLVFGDPNHISSTLIASPIVRMVTLTGSVGVGKHLSQLAGSFMKPVLMELGGNAPVLVCDGVDAAQIGRQAAMAKMRLSGQICASPSRFIVNQKVYDEFVSAFVVTAQAIRVGDGFDSGSQMGPVANARRLAMMQNIVDDARARGARIATGGHRIGNRGYYFAPTLIADAPLDSDAMRVEPFGPLGACVPFESLDEALRIANSISVGLSAYAFTNSLYESERIGRELDCGVVSINHFGAGGADTPFGGVKDSGIAREGGPTSLSAYTVSKTLLISTARV